MGGIGRHDGSWVSLGKLDQIPWHPIANRRKTAVNLDGFLFRTIDKVKVKGKDGVLTCYEPLSVLAGAT